ncbi:hypothetical protein I6N95_11695 [Vagococcus sp. BWB3-3]|uniref:Uncharacterized protein n=1 Tax=Vagococcus allomyrinae TaxID=2794353 RepID=A0A940P8L0_9ENTE|nr:hypothetical protein [Vagococcus allomyrinae]MBP1041671.1 hypothetical protein [Vagococcus allomyrinae]
MTEKQFKEWLRASNESMMKQQQLMLYLQIVLTFSLVLYVIRWLPVILMILGLIIAIGIYKKSFDEPAYINLSLFSLDDNLPKEKESWYYKDPRYPSGVMLLKSNLTQVIKYNNYLGYRILIYILLTMMWYLIS